MWTFGRWLVLLALSASVVFLPPDRVVAGGPAVINTGDSGAGTLRNAVAGAHPGDIIIFVLPPNSVIALTTGEIVIDKDLTILGSTAVNLTVSGNNASRVLSITPGATVTITHLTIAGGNMQDNGGGVSNWGKLVLQECTVRDNASSGPSVSGGGIFNVGTLIADTVTVSGNTTSGAGGGIYNRTGAHALIRNALIISNTANMGGGGIFTHGDASVTASAVVSNTTRGDGGGGIYVYTAGTLQLSNSTLSGNAALDGAGGGAIYQVQMGTDNSISTLLNSTIANNSAAAPREGESGLWLAGIGAVMQLGDAIVAGNGITGNFSIGAGTVFSSLGYNLTDSSMPNSIATDMTNTNPLIGSLADNGGGTLTHGLLSGSPAVNAGDPAFAPPPEFDQRGANYPRVVGGRIDIGAYEFVRRISLPVILNRSTPQVGPSIVISTVMYQGTPALNMADQYVDLRNRGNTAVNIGGWTLTAVSTSKAVEFPYGLVMQPGQVCRVYTNAPVDYGNCGALSFYSPVPVWSTTLDVAELRDANNNMVDVYSYTQVPR